MQSPKLRATGGIPNRLCAIVSALVSAGNWLAQLLVLGMVLLFAYEVVLRVFFKSATGFADQASAYAMAAITYFSLAHTFRVGGHVDADILTSQLSDPWRRRLAVVTGILTVVVTAVFLWSAIGTVSRSFADEDRAMIGLWYFPVYLPQIVMPVGLALLLLQMLAGVLDRKDAARE